MNRPFDRVEETYQSFSGQGRNEQFMQYQMRQEQQHFQPPMVSGPRKSKFIATIFSMGFPGTGHFYLGLFHRGLMFMSMFITNILLIIYFANNNYAPFHELPIVLFALIMPVIYLYCLFDSVHQVDGLRRMQQHGATAPYPAPFHFGYSEQEKASALLFWIPLICLLVFLLISGKGGLWNIFSWNFTYLGVVMLLTAGATIYLMATRKKQ